VTIGTTLVVPPDVALANVALTVDGAPDTAPVAPLYDSPLSEAVTNVEPLFPLIESVTEVLVVNVLPLEDVIVVPATIVIPLTSALNESLVN
jgi:hypothetical protein